ncbi:Dihydrodipicolinate synthase [Liberibacter crescens BT-1]|uniref:4-hydroxy-tetrahydrodipicolinate synthase n=1 Tax=Liberibacter crescens (strain BT-1) TaxID=1215343 RepID=L0EV79_LIBCB|nr:4-hydroxy-tetrahydrodipicolinate synthase [Liberibacter crescens]AGA64543.1 Dihydrodipicolinate synthase [Liberibacter crescens BT-1]
MFKGSIPALITPFTSTGLVDEDALCDHIEWQICEGASGLVPVGTTGESPTLSHDEHNRVVEICVKVAAGRVPIMSGAGSNNTKEAIELAQYAKQVGVDAILSVTPYYNKPNRKGLIEHFSALARSVKLPIYIYNIPGRSVIDMTPDIMAELVKAHSNIVGVKDATGRVDRVSEQRMLCGLQFVQLSGEDASALGFNAHGGVGCISVTANVAPRLCSEFQETMQRGEYHKALEYQDRLLPLHKALFIEPGVCGVKYALSRLGRKICFSVRSPMIAHLEPETIAAIDAALDHAGLLS